MKDKNIYESPKIKLISVTTKDIITISIIEGEIVKSDTFLS